MDEKFNMFTETVDGRFRSFVNQINEYLIENGCKCDIKSQKSGYVVSYVLNSNKKDFGNIRIPKNGNEAPYLSRTYTEVPELS